MAATSVEQRHRLPASVWRMAIAAGMAFYLDAATLISVSVSLPVWRDAYQLGTWEVGLLGGGLASTVAAGSLVGGWLGDRYGRSEIFTYDLIVFCVGTLLITLAPGPGLLIAGVLTVGLAIGADMPTGLAVIADAATRLRPGPVERGHAGVVDPGGAVHLRCGGRGV